MSIANTVPVRPARAVARPLLAGSTLMLVILFASACSGSSGVSAGAADIITVEGRVTYYGNVPFEQAILVTDDRNWYVLDLGDDQRLQLVTPSRQRVQGRVYLGDWNGRPFAHLDVREIERVDG